MAKRNTQNLACVFVVQLYAIKKGVRVFKPLTIDFYDPMTPFNNKKELAHLCAATYVVGSKAGLSLSLNLLLRLRR